eukprot:CAMPEP_0170536860 /NCGR_PEP_ID=MMETSP0209-20121228/102385_1 /TAXON_ID=665100 ORGANISM="Litonotus pictus, Strain P1" /NCGR_SAMPLE_ID=MMETSP0209 /ASSEMBLY_ACC=CAM_ASM_000301 /LENGTH=238 /DNA_ID=CAMNT_0010838271 /DNA_START=603 /DNA_END=1319 /DNA_ORIENTATION=+
MRSKNNLNNNSNFHNTQVRSKEQTSNFCIESRSTQRNYNPGLKLPDLVIEKGAKFDFLSEFREPAPKASMSCTLDAKKGLPLILTEESKQQKKEQPEQPKEQKSLVFKKRFKKKEQPEQKYQVFKERFAKSEIQFSKTNISKINKTAKPLTSQERKKSNSLTNKESFIEMNESEKKSIGENSRILHDAIPILNNMLLSITQNKEMIPNLGPLKLSVKIKEANCALLMAVKRRHFARKS